MIQRYYLGIYDLCIIKNVGIEIEGFYFLIFFEFHYFGTFIALNLLWTKNSNCYLSTTLYLMKVVLAARKLTCTLRDIFLKPFALLLKNHI